MKLVIAEMLLSSTFILAEPDMHLQCLFEKAFLSKVFKALPGKRLSNRDMKTWIGNPKEQYPRPLVNILQMLVHPP